MAGSRKPSEQQQSSGSDSTRSPRTSVLRTFRDAWVSPELLEDGEVRRHASILLFFSAALSVLICVRIAGLIAAGMWAQSVVLTALAACIAACPFLLRRGHLALAGNLLLGGMFVCGFLFAIQRGGIGAPVLVAISFVPLTLCLIGNVRSGIAWTAVGIVGVVALMAYEATVGPLPDRVPSEQRLVLEGVGVVLFLLGALAVGLAVDWSKRAAVADKNRVVAAGELASQEARLARAERMAALGQLAAGVAHEINNPLAYVDANIEYLRQQIDGMGPDGVPGKSYDELLAAADEAREGLMRVATIVRDLKTFARDSSNEEACVVESAVSSTLRMASKQLGRGTMLHTDVSPDLPRARMDEARLVQVLLNLVINAAQSFESEQQGATITVRARTVNTGQAAAVRIDVEDNGCGMSQDVLARATEPFFTTKAETTGTGLGLSVCASLVERSGGTMSIHSRQGQGTRVTIELHAVAGEELPRPRHSIPHEPPSVSTHYRVLLIDDDKFVLRSLRRVLRDHLVFTASTVDEAVAEIERATFDVIVCDLVMPGRGGADFFEEVKKRAPTLLSRIVFLSGGATTPEDRAFVERIPNACYDKPLPPDKVTAILRKTVQGASAKWKRGSERSGPHRITREREVAESGTRRTGASESEAS